MRLITIFSVVISYNVTVNVLQGLLICGTVFYRVPMMGEYSYPNWAVGLGWLIGLFPILLLPLYAMYYGCRHGGLQVSGLIQYCERWIHLFLHFVVCLRCKMMCCAVL
jgi:hypothetical protein